MSLIVPPGFGLAAFTFSGTEGTAPYVTTLGIDISGFGGDHVAAANSAFSNYFEAFAAETSDELTLDKVSLHVGQDGPSGSVDSTASPVNGTSRGTFEPTAMSYIANKQTNDIGRRGRGRMFLPGTARDTEVVQDGSISESARARYVGVLDTFMDNLTNGTVVSDPTPPVLFHSTAPADPTPIVGFNLAPLVGWVRGRIR